MNTNRFSAKIVGIDGSFKADGLPYTATALTEMYSIENQKKRFTALLGSADKIKNNNKHYLAKGHLTPDADGIFNTWQMATYYYINVFPQWQVINNGNWKGIENLVRKKASIYNEPVEVYTGIHEVLKYNGIEITLDVGGKLKAPKWIWKVLIHRGKVDKGIAFLTLNDPYAVRYEPLCVGSKCVEDRCADYQWSVIFRQENQDLQLANIESGYTVCSNIMRLVELGVQIPLEAQVRTDMTFFEDD